MRRKKKILIYAVFALLLLVAGWQSWRLRSGSGILGAPAGATREEITASWEEYRSEDPPFVVRYPVHLTIAAETQKSGGTRLALNNGGRLEYDIEVFPSRGVSAPNLLESIPGANKIIETAEVGPLDGRLMTYQSTDGQNRAAMAAARSDWSVLAVDQNYGSADEEEFRTILWSLRLTAPEGTPASQ